MEDSFFPLVSAIWSYSKLFFLAALFTLVLMNAIKHPPYTYRRHMYKLPPGPKPWPIIGNLPELLSNKPAVPKWIHKLMKNLDTEIACFKFGNVHVIPVTSPDIACEFLKKQDCVFASRPMNLSSDLISGGYLTTALVPYEGQWKKMKKIISKDLLSPMKHQWLHSKRMQEANHLMHYIYYQSKSKNGSVNLRITAQHFCGNVIKKIIFSKRYFGNGGGDDGGPGLEEVEHLDAVFRLLNHLFSFCVSDFMPSLRGFDLEGHGRIVKNALRTVNMYHDPIIEARIEQWKDGLKTETEDLLDVMISLKDAHNNSLLTTQEIKALILEMMMATVDNPSNAVEWALAEMINQPELLQKATLELDQVVGKHRLVEESDIPKLNYTKACLREAFRLHPISPFNVPHVSMSDTVVSNYFIPKGSHVLLSRQELGRNPKVWKDEPLKFTPERHLMDHNRCDVFLSEPNLRFISFSTGTRGCPGVLLGTTITVMMFARLVHGFTWSAPPNQPIELVESQNDLLLAKPLVAMAHPRLPKQVYHMG